VSRGVFLRRAEPKDATAVAALEGVSSLHPWSEAQLRVELERTAPDAVLVLEGRGGIVAYVALRVVLDEMHVMNLAVRPEARRRGLGRFLLSRALARASRAGARRVLLEVRAGNAAARTLYTECGFVPLGLRKQYYALPPDDALVLVREGLDRSR
jgi:[ribosomal protein S18]-alanine N-acetyltransferase